jgi:hypothetical protein
MKVNLVTVAGLQKSVSKFEFEPNHPASRLRGVRLYRAALLSGVILQLPPGRSECLSDGLREFLLRLPVHRQLFAGTGKPALHGKWASLAMMLDCRRTHRDFAAAEVRIEMLEPGCLLTNLGLERFAKGKSRETIFKGRCIVFGRYSSERAR